MNAPLHTPGRLGYDEARKAIQEGKATPHALWMILSSEHDRDGYALKPSPWEGPGEYQKVSFEGDCYRLIRLPTEAPSLIALAKAEGRS